MAVKQESPAIAAGLAGERQLSAEKVESILDALLGDDGFTCHNTIAVMGKPSVQAKACLGAAIFLEHVRVGGLRANLAFRFREGVLKEFHRDELNMDAAVFADVTSFTRAKQVPSSLTSQR